MRATKLEANFVVADAQYPSLVSAPGRLAVSFVDYTGENVVVEFEDVCAFRWQEGDRPLLEGEPYDGVCEVHRSEWAQQHLPSSTMHAGKQVRHINLNFNAAGFLEVLCSGMSRRA